MSGQIYLIQDDGSLTPMSEAEYNSEDLLQSLLVEHPNLLAGDQINTRSPRRWLMIKREAGIPSEEGGYERWAVDHLFLDQDGIPTLVEVKRSTDTRIRREVVGQMLDYAANATSYWSVETLRSWLEAQYDSQALTIDEIISEFLDEPDSEVEFWQQVRDNFDTGRLRLIFVADVIPTELQRVVEFLNEHMDRIEVLAVEIKQFIGEGLRTLVPRVLGQTVETERRKSKQSDSPVRLDENGFYTSLESQQGSNITRIARQIFNWAKQHMPEIYWSVDRDKSAAIPYLIIDGTWYQALGVYKNGYVEIQFAYMRKKPHFEVESKRRELMAKLQQIPGIKGKLDPSNITGLPTFHLSALTNEADLEAFLGVFNWFVEEVKST